MLHHDLSWRQRENTCQCLSVWFQFLMSGVHVKSKSSQVINRSLGSTRPETDGPCSVSHAAAVTVQVIKDSYDVTVQIKIN